MSNQYANNFDHRGGAGFSEATSSKSSTYSDSGSSQQEAASQLVNGDSKPRQWPRSASAVSAILEATRISKASRALQSRLAMASFKARRGTMSAAETSGLDATYAAHEARASAGGIKRAHSSLALSGLPPGTAQLALKTHADGSLGTELVSTPMRAPPETPGTTTREERMFMSTSRKKEKHRAKHAARRASTGQGSLSSPLSASDHRYPGYPLWASGGGQDVASGSAGRDVDSVSAANALTSMVSAGGATSADSRPRTVTQELLMSGFGHIPSTPPRVSATRHEQIGTLSSRRPAGNLNIDTRVAGQEDDAAQLMLYLAASPSPARSRQSSYAGSHVAGGLAHERVNSAHGMLSHLDTPRHRYHSANGLERHAVASDDVDGRKVSPADRFDASFHSEHHPVTPSRGMNMHSTGYTPLGLGWHTGMTPDAAALHAGRDRERELATIAGYTGDTSPSSSKTSRQDAVLTSSWPTRQRLNFDEGSEPAGGLDDFGSSSGSSSQHSQPQAPESAPLPAMSLSQVKKSRKGGSAIRGALLPPMGPPVARSAASSTNAGPVASTGSAELVRVGAHSTNGLQRHTPEDPGSASATASTGHSGMSSPVKGLSLE